MFFGYTALPDVLGIPNDILLADIGLGMFGNGYFFGFITNDLGVYGPFGFGSMLLSLLVPFSIAMFLLFYLSIDSLIQC